MRGVVVVRSCGLYFLTGVSSDAGNSENARTRKTWWSGRMISAQSAWIPDASYSRKHPVSYSGETSLFPCWPNSNIEVHSWRSSADYPLCLTFVLTSYFTVNTIDAQKLVYIHMVRCAATQPPVDQPLLSIASYFNIWEYIGTPYHTRHWAGQDMSRLFHVL